MTDELTPEEREALKTLPKERMPSAGLEDRVVGALRERNVLSKRRRRTIEITNSRVAGLLAASLVVVIGAYSMGVYWGGGDSNLPGTAMIERDDRGRAGEAAIDRSDGSDEVAELEEFTDRDAVSAKGKAATDSDMSVETKEEGFATLEQDVASPSQDKASEPALTSRQDATQSQKDQPVARLSPEKTTPPPATSPTEEMALQSSSPPPEKTPVANSSTKKDSPSPETQTLMKQSAGRQSEPRKLTARSRENIATEVSDIAERPLRFMLNGQWVIVEAPDSVRVVQDDRGRMLIIHTSDGIIRIRMADGE